MFTEAVSPVLIGLVVYGTLGLVVLIWFVARPRPLPFVDKSVSS